MVDITEGIRREMVGRLNSEVESMSPETERKRLEAIHGKIWDTKELQNDFTVIGFAAPFIVVKRTSDGKSGSMMFQHYPRFYFDFSADK